MYTQTSSGLLRGGTAANVQMHRVLFICAELCRARGPNVETFISILYKYIRTSRLALRHSCCKRIIWSFARSTDGFQKHRQTARFVERDCEV